MRHARHYIFFKSSAALVREPPELPGLGEEAIPLIFDHTIYFILLLFWGRGVGGGKQEKEVKGFFSNGQSIAAVQTK